MKAITITKYGDIDKVLKLSKVEKPSPKDNEVLIEVHACSLTFSNLMLVKGKPFIARLFGMGLFKPKQKIPGSDVSGIIVDTGKKVSKFKIGDEVYVDTASHGRSGLAEYVTAPEAVISQKPNNISHAEASAFPEAALVALQALRDNGKISRGNEVCIIGASGGIGSLAVQIAKYYGAEVTGVTSTRNLEMVKSIGADHVIDYTNDHFSAKGPYDLIVSTAGFNPIKEYKYALKPNGIYVSTGGTMKQIFQAGILGPVLSERKGRKLGNMIVKTNIDLEFLRVLIEEGHVKPVIDKVYSFEETTEAFKHYGTGRARGKIVVKIK